VDLLKAIIGRLNFFLNYRELFLQLVARDIKLKYRRSLLGYLWSVLNPLLTMMVMYIVFSEMFKWNIDNFAVYLLIGNMMFSFMANAVSRSIFSIVGNAALLKKTFVPKYIFTVSSVTSELVNLFFSLIALILVVIITRSPLTWRVVLIIIPVVELYVFCLGLGLLLAQSAVFFRDTQYLWGILSTIWMYLTPIFYPVTLLPEPLQSGVKQFNPMFIYIDMFRSFGLWAKAVSVSSIMSGALMAVVTLVIGLWSFSITKRKFVLYI
jgi:lipopolysaccharide transport system permease protein